MQKMESNGRLQSQERNPHPILGFSISSKSPLRDWSGKFGLPFLELNLELHDPEK